MITHQFYKLWKFEKLCLESVYNLLTIIEKTKLCASYNRRIEMKPFSRYCDRAHPNNSERKCFGSNSYVDLDITLVLWFLDNINNVNIIRLL